MHELTDNQLNEILETAGEARKNSEAIDMQDVKNSVDVDIEAELDKEIIEGKIDDSTDLVSATVEKYPEADVSLFDLDGDQIVQNTDELPKNEIAEAARNNYDLSDEEVLKLLDVMSNMKKDNNYPIYKNLPEKLKDVIKEIALKNGIPASNFNMLARMIMNEFVDDANLQSAFIDLEKALNDALKIPSVVDIYTDHIKTVMEENIPAMIEEIKDDYPEKAKLLGDVRERFIKSYTYELAKESYENNARIRKAVRRYDMEIKRALDDFNFKNEKSNFKMNDVREMPDVLVHILIEEPKTIKDEEDCPEYVQKAIDSKITEADIKKFCVMLCKSCENMDAKSLLDATYMYYMMKNIIVLKYSKETKTAFAAELINNICDTIIFIRNKEAEFNATNMVKPKL